MQDQRGAGTLGFLRVVACGFGVRVVAVGDDVCKSFFLIGESLFFFESAALFLFFPEAEFLNKTSDFLDEVITFFLEGFFLRVCDAAYSHYLQPVVAFETFEKAF